jgi:hypothetical protein
MADHGQAGGRTPQADREPAAGGFDRLLGQGDALRG